MLTTGFPRFKGDLFGSFIMELAKRLIAQKIAVEVIAPHEDGLLREEQMDGVLIRRFRYMFPASWQKVAYQGGIPTNLSQSWVTRIQIPLFLVGFWLKGVWAARGCDVIHCHWSISGLIAYLAVRPWGPPIVLSVRGSDIHLLEKGLMRWLNRMIFRWMDVIVAVSEDIGGKLEREGVAKEKIRIVYNGVDERFSPGDTREARGRLGLPESRFILLFVGLLVPVKGLDILIEAVRLLNDERLLCVLVGDGSMLDSLREQVEKADLQESVFFAGRRPSQEIPVWMNAADVLVLPSFSEGRPNVVLEAQACNLPVVATRVGGTPELITDGVDGLLVDSGVPGPLADKISVLMDSNSLRQKLGQAGGDRIQRQGLTWDASTSRMKEIYRDLLERV